MMMEIRSKYSRYQVRWFIFFVWGCLQLCSVLQGYAQDRRNCSSVISGYIKDDQNVGGLSHANIYVEETGKMVQADDKGYFALDAICHTTYHLVVSHPDGEELSFTIHTVGDTSITLRLHRDVHKLSEVTVHADRMSGLMNVISLSKSKIMMEGRKDISEIFARLPGVNILRTNIGISKPIIDGLYGNRVEILNNGVVQSGQVWGNDHAPEIDAFSADHISLIRGVQVLRYTSSMVGQVLSSEPSDISKDAHLHAILNYMLGTNDGGHTLNASVQRYTPAVSFKFNLTYKKSGDSRAPMYTLSNTGKEEIDLSVLLQKQIKKSDVSLYYSFFSTKIGILRGSQIANLTDLEAAIRRDTPYYTSPFSYDIAPPNQVVSHHLLKVSLSHPLSSHSSLQLMYAMQLNQRDEFDVRRAGRSGIPALSIFQYTGQGYIYYQHQFGHGLDWLFRSGIQLKNVYNVNDLGTGILPLIPDYVALQPIAFASVERKKNQWQYAVGARYEYQDLRVRTFLRNQTVENYTHQFSSYNLMGDLQYYFNDRDHLWFSAIYGFRSPAINELYSQGLHQGVSGLELGNAKLKPEIGGKWMLSGEWLLGRSVKLYATTFVQHIKDYIYLQPQQEFRLTIRGAFPVYTYDQTDALIYGGTFLFSYQPTRRWNAELKLPIVRGEDLSNHIPLVYMPSDRFSFLVAHQFLSDKAKASVRMVAMYEYIWKQYRLLSQQDFLEPPPSYGRLGLKLETYFYLHKHRVEFNINAENVFNTSYRDYLNRLRYFADEPGFNLILHIQYKF